MLEDRISNLCAAVPCASARASTLETVLREIVDSARALTGARYGLITTVDDAGQPQDFVTAGPRVRRARGDGRVGGRTAALRALPGPARALAGGGPAGLRAGARLLDGADRVEDDAVHADAPPRRPRRQLLPRREGGRAGVHERRRGGPGPGSRRRRRRPSQTPARTGPNSGPGPTSRPWSKPRR